MDGQYSYLHRMVERSTTALLGRDSKPTDRLVFLGNPQLVFPRLLFEDPALEPVDRNVWVAIKLAAADVGTIAAFPSYEELMRRCNIGSKATISRSLSILRSTRWLTVCKARQRDTHGRIRGNIYALHDEPLQLPGTLQLDEDYMGWLEEASTGKHTHHPRAVAIACAVKRDMLAQLQAGKDNTAFADPLPRRVMATAAQVVAGGGVRGRIGHTVQKLYLNVSTETVLHSSSNKYIYKTTTTPTPVVTTEVGVSAETALVWPDGLSRADKGVLREQLAITPRQYHQPVLDALAVKLAEVAAGRSQPLRNGILPYTRKLRALALVGKLNPVPRPASAKPADNPNNHQQPDPGRELKELEAKVSGLANEARHLKMLGQAGGFTPARLHEVTEEWRSASQRYGQMKQVLEEMQGRVLR